MTNPWLAVDVTTNSALRARELRLARDRFLGGEPAPPGVRAPIVDSWRRSATHGLDPSLGAAPIEMTEREATALLRDHPLGRFAPLLQQSLGAVSGASDHLIAVSDADGLLLAVDGSWRTRQEAASRVGMVPGARFSETAAGTNAIGTALAAGRPVQVFAAEHFCEHSQWWTCAAAPVHDRASGRLLGAVNLTAPMETVHPHTLALVAATAALIEMSWRLAGEPGDAGGVEILPDARRSPPARGLRLSGADAARPPLLELTSLGIDRADVRLDGQAVHLSLRHSELLVLLATQANGMTAEQLALRLHGEGGKPVTARAELSRLRRILPGCIETDPYRLVATPRTDFGEVQQLLRDGQARAAVQRYSGRLLPRSEAPGIVDLRDELEGWARRAVMGSDDVETLWSWLTTPSGEEDLHAWKRFVANLPHDDGRRGLAAARLERLRPLLTVSR
jgi:hypothetical protein